MEQLGNIPSDYKTYFSSISCKAEGGLTTKKDRVVLNIQLGLSQSILLPAGFVRSNPLVKQNWVLFFTDGLKSDDHDGFGMINLNGLI